MKLFARFSFVVVLVSLVACHASTQSTLPVMADRRARDIWERGPLPERWQFFENLYGNGSDITYLRWAAADKAGHLWVAQHNLDYFGDACGDYWILLEFNQSGSFLGAHNDGPEVCGRTFNRLLIGGDGNIYTAYGSAVTGIAPNGRQLGSTDVSNNVNDVGVGPNGDIFAACNCVRQINGQNRPYLIRFHNWVRSIYYVPSIPASVAVDKNNHVWLNILGKLVSLNPANGALSAYSTQVVGAYLYVGPDDNLWSVSQSTLSRITTSSNPPAVTKVALPMAVNPYIANDPNGTLWLQSSSTLLNLSTAGRLLGTYSCPTSSCNSANGDSMQGLAVATDDNVWFAFSGGEVYNASGTVSTDPYNGIAAYVRLSINVIPSTATLPKPGATTTLSVSETSYSGTWTAASTQQTVVRVVRWLSKSQVLIQAVGKGTGRIIIKDAKTNYVGIPITVQ